MAMIKVAPVQVAVSCDPFTGAPRTVRAAGDLLDVLEVERVRDESKAYPLGEGPGGKGTSTGSYSPYGNQVPVGDWNLLGFPETILNGSVRYRFASGFGVGGNAQYTGQQQGNLDNQWHIPAQYLFNTSLFYETKKWIVNVDFLNITNERNWSHNGDAFSGSILVFQEQPFRIEGYVKIKF